LLYLRDPVACTKRLKRKQNVFRYIPRPKAIIQSQKPTHYRKSRWISAKIASTHFAKENQNGNRVL